MNWIFYVIVVLSVIGLVVQLVEYVKENEWFSEKFITTFIWVVSILGFFAVLGGVLKDNYDLFIASWGKDKYPIIDFFPYFIGSVLGLLISSLLITYLVRLIAPMFIFIHKSTNDGLNKKDTNIKSEVPSETELKDFLAVCRESYPTVVTNWEYWEDVYQAWLKNSYLEIPSSNELSEFLNLHQISYLECKSKWHGYWENEYKKWLKSK